MDSPSTPPTYEIFRDKHGIPQFSPKRGTRSLLNALSYTFPTLETELQLMQAALQKFFDSEKRGSGTFICELPENNLQNSLKGKKDDVESPLPGADAFLRSWKVALEPQRGASRCSSRVEGRTPALTSRNTSRASSRCRTPLYREPELENSKGGSMTTWSLSSGQEIEKKKRTPYDPVKRRKVAENRGNACEKHRSQKTACDPASCPQNKLYSKTIGRSRRGSSILVPEASRSGFDVEAELTKLIQNTGVSTPRLDFTESGIPNGTEDFWDSSFCNLMPIQSHTSQASLHGSFMTNTSGSSSEGTSTAAYDGSPYSNPDIPESNTQHALFSTVFELRGSSTDQQKVESNGIDFSSGSTAALLGLDSLIDESSPQVWESPEDSLLWQLPTEQPEIEDPFMGCNQRSSQNLDEYGWVLSHVEHL